MIDLHCHVLPGVDDGAPDLDTSVAMAKVAADDGVRKMVATPHVNSTYWPRPDVLVELLSALNARLRREDVPVVVLSGAEVSISRVGELDDADLRAYALPGSDYVLLESPFVRAADFLEQIVFDLELRGFKTILAHPERSPLFQADPDRLERLVERGVLCSITAGSLAGSFGGHVRRFTLELLRRGLAHDLASDAHDAERRSPRLRFAFEEAERDLPGLTALSEWLTHDVPAALLARHPVPDRPELPPPSRRWRVLTRGG